MDRPKYRVYVCCGRNCGPKGSRQLVTFLENEVERLSLQDRVSIYPGGCQNHCDSGPTMVVYPGPVFYQEVDRQRITRIATEHLANDRPVPDYFWVDTGVPNPGIVKRKFVFSPTAPPPKHDAPRNDQPSPRPKPKKTYDVDDFKW